jgi:hypothetical protein
MREGWKNDKKVKKWENKKDIYSAPDMIRTDRSVTDCRNFTD